MVIVFPSAERDSKTIFLLSYCKVGAAEREWSDPDVGVSLLGRRPKLREFLLPYGRRFLLIYSYTLAPNILLLRCQLMVTLF